MIENLGPYRIEKVVGRGGMGTVYAGVHQETGQQAAVKALSRALDDDSNFRDRFAAEIATLRKLDHPNIVQLYGEGVQDGYLFFAMQYVPGQSLQQMLQSGYQFEWQQVSRLAIEICAALQHAHDRGVIHRDLKPANLLYDQDGRIKLTDFGIAKLFGGTQLTAAGSVVGTADYMSPEQAQGRQVTSRSDLYGLGSVMFTLLARRPPYSGSSLPQVVHSIRYDEVPSVRRFAPSVPRALDEIISQLLQKDPEDRIATARAVANRLKAVQDALGDAGESQSATNQDTDTQVRNSLGDAATRASPPDRGAATEVPPTAVDSAASSAPSESWHNSTIITSEGSKNQDQLAARDTIADTPDSYQDRFFSSDARSSLGYEDHVNGEPPLVTHLKTALLGLGFVALIAATIWGMWPASADRLYGRIVSITKEKSPSDAKKYIDEFIKRFPNDSRLDEVDDLRMDVECRSLQKSLALRFLGSGGSSLAPFEQRFLEAMRLIPKNPAAARARFREFVEVYEIAKKAPPELAKFLDAARHQLKRLENVSS